MKMRNGANSAWISLYELDGTFLASDISLAAGSAAAPSLFFTGDTNTGIYSPGADQIGIATGGTARITVDGSGNVNIDSDTLYIDAANNRVGIGTNAPATPLHVAVTTDGPQTLLFLVNNSEGGTNETAALQFGVRGTGGGSACKIIAGKESDHSSPANIDNFLQFTTTENDAEAVRMHITAAGRVGIGTTSPETVLDVFGAPHVNYGSATLFDSTSTAANVGGVLTLGGYKTAQTAKALFGFIKGGKENATSGNESGYLAFGTNNNSSNSEKARIDSSGRLLVGTASRLLSDARNRLNVDSGSGTFVTGSFKNDAGSAAQVIETWNASTSGDAKFISFLTEAAGTERGLIDYNRAAGLVRYNVTSDQRLKSAIQPATSAVDLLSSIQVRSYIWTETGYTVNYGFVAQELNQVLPDAVKVGDDGEEVQDTWAVDNSKLVPLLTKALQEAIAKIEALEADVAALKGA
jgi:hypothetical protein